MEVNDVFNDNMFIRRALNLYTDTITDKKAYTITNETVEKTKWFSGEHKKVEVPVTKEVPILNEYLSHAKALAIHPLWFNTMWQFCQFVRWAEKIVFYKNVSDNIIYVDSAIDDLDCRLLVYHENDVQIQFKLEKVANPAYIPNTLSDVLSMNKDVPRYFKSMKILVDRLYGKEMSNRFTILDDDTNFDDFSDELLYNNIEKKLTNAVEETTKLIFTMISVIYKEEYD